jgi:hypothetical protein
MVDFKSMRRDGDRVKDLLAKLTNGKPAEYYAQHVKNLGVFGPFFENEIIDRILAICTGVENLVLTTPFRGLNFFENPQAGRNLRRLSVRLENFFPQISIPNFHHPCFANLTHLHLWDEAEYWSIYPGWETLTSLTHLAFSCSGHEKVMKVMRTLPTVRYVALGYYYSGERYKYAHAAVNNSPHIRAAWGVRVVVLSEIPEYDWEQGVRGEGDFWDLVEREVERRLDEGSVE